MVVGHLIEVAFRGNRKEFFSWDGEQPPPLRAAIIVDADRGEDFGRVHATGELAAVRCNGCAHGCGTAPPPRKALRLATKEDEKLDRELTALNEQARRASMERVKSNGLVMKLTDAEWQWDRRKLTLFFTAEKRVDFRGLVRDLAAQFKTRIELKQIGVRDEAKRLSGVGRCGREYCSASWLPDLRPVNLGVAKDQKLSLNPQQISGACGRLMCCLRYEHEFYVQSRRKFPKEGKILVTSRGEEKVVSCDIFHERVTLRTVEGDTRVMGLAALKAEVEGEVASSESEGAVGVVVGIEATLDSATVAMLDTAEYALPVGVLVGAEAEPADSADSVEPGSENSAADGESAQRRKRRRGRRGGRRLRAAEGRGTDDALESPDEDADV
ncbi:stage 0 sporulation family protein [Gemmatimonas sp.]|uniref:stage 0 sporulation family protein n=1 Tax=Gemmatimonas sp. TaxID=1962908 RepID=UPI0037BEE496